MITIDANMEKTPTGGDDPQWADLSGYRRYLEEELCWADGTPTQQNRCPMCQVIWDNTFKRARFKAMLEFCAGGNAIQIAKVIGQLKIHAPAYFNNFTNGMEEIVAGMILSGEIATRPTCREELGELERALRTGHQKHRTKACRHIFFESLALEQRSEALFHNLLLPEIRDYVRQVESRAKQAKPPVDSQKPQSIPGDHSQSDDTRSRRSFIKWCGQFFNHIRNRGTYSPTLPSRACEQQGPLWVRTWVALRPPSSPEAEVNYETIPDSPSETNEPKIPKDYPPVHFREPSPSITLGVSAENLRKCIPEAVGALRAVYYPKPATRTIMMIATNSLVDVWELGDFLLNPPESSARALYKAFADRFELPQLTPDQENKMCRLEEEVFEKEMHLSWRKRPVRYLKWRFSRWQEISAARFPPPRTRRTT